jgi:hypothetical protein
VLTIRTVTAALRVVRTGQALYTQSMDAVCEPGSYEGKKANIVTYEASSI